MGASGPAPPPRRDNATSYTHEHTPATALAGASPALAPGRAGRKPSRCPQAEMDQHIHLMVTAVDGMAPTRSVPAAGVGAVAVLHTGTVEDPRHGRRFGVQGYIPVVRTIAETTSHEQSRSADSWPQRPAFSTSTTRVTTSNREIHTRRQ